MDWYINTYSQQTTSFAIDKSLAEIHTNNLHTANKQLTESFTKNISSTIWNVL